MFWAPHFIKIKHIAILRPKLQIFNFRSRSAISNIIFMINELDLLWVPNFIALGIYFIFGTKFSWNEGIDTCFNVECVLLGRNFDFLGGCLVVTACYLVVTWWILVLTARYGWLLLAITFSRNSFYYLYHNVGAVTQLKFTCSKYSHKKFKINNRNARKRWEVCSKLTIKTTKRRHWLWTYFTPFSRVTIVDFEQVSDSWQVRYSWQSFDTERHLHKNLL